MEGEDDEMGMDIEETEASNSSKKFDRRLPVTHSYLGATEEGELSTELLYAEPGSEIRVPVIVMAEISLLPGQTFPLQFATRPSIEFLSDSTRQRAYFALMTADEHAEIENAEDLSKVPCHHVGTLFQIQNILMTNRNGWMTVHAIGRQRCTLVTPLFRHNIYCEDLSVIICDSVNVRVLEEQLLPKQIIPETSNCTFNRLPRKECLKCLAALCPHSLFTLKQLSTDALLKKLKGWLLFWFKQRQIDLIVEQGLTIFSFWAAANIPMSLEKKLEILKEDSTDRRLRMEWRIASQMSSIVCIDCDDPKCSVSDMINLSVEGNSAHFVNPGGFVHDLFTVKRIEKINLRGEPTTEFSWFPGYAWTIMECNHCGSHIGWCFTSKQSIPKQFYGISRRSFRVACVKEPDVDRKNIT